MGAMAPKAVATPFPPLNPKKTGQMCPRQAAMAIKPSQKGLTPNSYAPPDGQHSFQNVENQYCYGCSLATDT